MKLILGMFFLTFIVATSYATAVTVTSTQLQTNYGVVASAYWVTSSSMGSTTPSSNTALAPPSGSGSFAIAKRASAYIWSRQFTSATTTSAGNWVLNLWASSSKSGSISVSVYVTDSTGAVVSTLVNGVNTASMSSNVETYTSTSFALAQVSIPANGYIEVVLSPPSGGSGTSYWGTGQMTDLQVPTVIATGY